MNSIAKNVFNKISKINVAGGWGRFSEELTDALEGQVLKYKNKSVKEIVYHIDNDASLRNLMRDEDMEIDDLTEFIESAGQLYNLPLNVNDEDKFDKDVFYIQKDIAGELTKFLQYGVKLDSLTVKARKLKNEQELKKIQKIRFQINSVIAAISLIEKEL